MWLVSRLGLVVSWEPPNPARFPSPSSPPTMPAGVSWTTYLKMVTASLLAMFAGAQVVHRYYRPDLVSAGGSCSLLLDRSLLPTAAKVILKRNQEQVCPGPQTLGWHPIAFRAMHVLLLHSLTLKSYAVLKSYTVWYPPATVLLPFPSCSLCCSHTGFLAVSQTHQACSHLKAMFFSS